MSFLHFDPVTVRECFGYWLSWRIQAAHSFALFAMHTSRDERVRTGNQDILSAPLGWYVPRFIAGYRLGKPWIVRNRRELRRKAAQLESVT